MDVIKFMKDQHADQKTVVENMTTLGASSDAAEYAMFIIDRQKKSIKRMKSAKSMANPTIELLEKKSSTKRMSLQSSTTIMRICMSIESVPR